MATLRKNGWITVQQDNRQLDITHLRAIADALNRRRIPTKQGGSWQANTVNKILRVHQERES
jgi:hypothetical protein